MTYGKVVVVGTGLIGGSIGKALIERRLAKEVIGVCRRVVSAEKAEKEGAVTSAVVNNYKESCAGADMVIIATPVDTIKDVIDRLSDCAFLPGAVVTDAGSTKKDIVEHAAKYTGKIIFVGSHPMAGSEKSGVENSRADMFEGSVCLVTPDKGTLPDSLKKVTDFWASLGAAVHKMSPEDHDHGMAFSSHLPHAAAYALAGLLEEKFPPYIFAGGFKDTTRIASSDVALWAEIFDSNRENVLEAIRKYKEKISSIERDISSSDKKNIREKLDKWRKLRDELV
ncbi:MAG: prephenate dehydrogenase/arogenate dehydrogenase family protein [Candidatus Omnitrophota bacterium]